MARRPPSAPPAITGFDYVRVLGTGGFADVFLYEQQLPRRQVAVKVLLGDRLDASTIASFTAEANIMAPLSAHPSIVSVHQAGIATDGRPYLVMEYCSRPNLQVRHRRERFSEAETLRIGVQIAGAVETAHRAGVLHRDIKPANILVTEYGRPALTDFGIAATASTEMAGMSVPWSPPESFRSPPEGDASSDVYSLAATLYTLLTNRSPFEILGASNTEIDLITRIQGMDLPPVGRADVSPALDAVLRRAMAKRRTARYARAIEFARALQRVQIELGMQATPVDVVEDEIDVHAEDDDGRTRFRSVTSIDAQPTGPTSPLPAGTMPMPPTAAGPAQPSPQPADATVRRAAAPPVLPAPSRAVAPTAPPVADTVRRGPAARAAEPAPTPRPARRRALTWGLAGAAVVVAAGVVVAVVAAPKGTDQPRATPAAAAPLDPAPAAQARQVQKLAGHVQGTDAVFTWTDPAPQPGDAYLWKQLALGQDPPFQKVEQPTVTVPLHGAAKVCVQVTLLPASGAYAAPVQACTP